MVILVIPSLIANSTSSNIFISYGCLYRSQSNLSRPSESFYTRQVSYPVLVTVYHMLECHNMDIFPLSVGDYDAGKTPVSKRRELFKDVEEEGWCLFTIDARNAYGLPFEVTLERVQDGQETCSECDVCLTVCSIGATPISTSCIVAPGEMTRCASFRTRPTRFS